MPATFTRMSKASPCRSNSPPTTRRRLSSSVTSRGTTSAEPPASDTSARVCSLPGALMSATATCAPASASARQVARPSPLAPPVTRATRPLSVPVTSMQLLRSCALGATITLAENGSARSSDAASASADGGDGAAGLPAQPVGPPHPDVGEGDRAQAALGDQVEQLPVHRGDRRVVGVADHDRLGGEPLPGEPDQLLAGDQAVVAEGGGPHHDRRVPLVGRYAVDPLVARAVRRPEERGVAG